jgi:hypothetical protein
MKINEASRQDAMRGEPRRSNATGPWSQTGSLRCNVRNRKSFGLGQSDYNPPRFRKAVPLHAIGRRLGLAWAIHRPGPLTHGRSRCKSTCKTPGNHSLYETMVSRKLQPKKYRLTTQFTTLVPFLESIQCTQRKR